MGGVLGRGWLWVRRISGSTRVAPLAALHRRWAARGEASDGAPLAGGAPREPDWYGQAVRAVLNHPAEGGGLETAGAFQVKSLTLGLYVWLWWAEDNKYTVCVPTVSSCGLACTRELPIAVKVALLHLDDCSSFVDWIMRKKRRAAVLPKISIEFGLNSIKWLLLYMYCCFKFPYKKPESEKKSGIPFIVVSNNFLKNAAYSCDKLVFYAQSCFERKIGINEGCVE